MGSAASGPSAIDTATARLRSTMGDGASLPSASYTSTIRSQFVSATDGATAWHSAIAACSPYAPRPRPPAPARARAARPRRIAPWSQRIRFCCSSSTGSPSGPMRAGNREAVSSNKASNPCTSDSEGISRDSTRARRSASLARSTRIRSAPELAEEPSVKIEVHDAEHRPQPCRPVRRRSAPRTAPAPPPASSSPG